MPHVKSANTVNKLLYTFLWPAWGGVEGVNLELRGPSSAAVQSSQSVIIGPFLQHQLTFSQNNTEITSTYRILTKKNMCLVIHVTVQTSTVVCLYPSILFTAETGHLREVLSNYKLLRKYRKNKPFSASKHADRNVVTVYSFTVVSSSENGKFIPCHIISTQFIDS